MGIAIASYSFHGLLSQGKIDVFGYLESLKFRYHVDNADIWSGILQSLDEDYLNKVRDALDEREISLANLCVDGPHVWEPDEEQRETNYRNALRYIRAGETLGAKTIRIDMGGRDLEMSEAQFEYTVKRYREYAQLAADGGFRIGPENHWGASRSLENITRVVEAVSNPSFGILLHLENWDQDPERGDEVGANYAFHTHFAAWVMPRYEEKIKWLQNANYPGVFSVEHHSAHNEYSEVEYQLAYLRRTLRQMSHPGPEQE